MNSAKRGKWLKHWRKRSEDHVHLGLPRGIEIALSVLERETWVLVEGCSWNIRTPHDFLRVPFSVLVPRLLGF